MASFAYDSYLDDVLAGSITKADTYYVMLTTSTYAPSQATHTKRSQVTNEVTGTGYTAGGQAIVPVFAKDTTNHKVTVTFPQVTWPSSTITARRAVYYKRRGGASTADELVSQDEFQVPVAPQTISSITASGQVATLTTAAAHGLNTGDTIVVSNAAPSAYNGTFSFTKLTATTGTYSTASAPSGPASSVGAYTAGTPTDVTTSGGTFTLNATTITLNTPA